VSGLTPQEEQELAELTQDLGGLTPDEYQELTALQDELGMPAELPSGPSAAEYAIDFDATLAKAAMNATEGLMDIAGLPISLNQRAIAGVKNLLDDDPETGFWSGAMQTPKWGQQTRDIFKPAHDILDDVRLKDGEVPKAYEFGRRVVDYGAPVLVSGGVGGAPTAGVLGLDFLVGLRAR